MTAREFNIDEGANRIKLLNRIDNFVVLYVLLTLGGFAGESIESSVLESKIENPTKEMAFVGRWRGVASTTNERTRLVLDVSRPNGRYRATITLPDVGVMGWPARAVEVTSEGMALTFPTDSSDQVLALSSDSTDILSGSWKDTQFQEMAVLRLKRTPQAENTRSEAVLIEAPIGKLDAEMILPTGEGPFPGVIFLHGSGPQPKEASRFAAVALAELGVASVIYDKRGVGGSEGSWQEASFVDLAEDGVSVARFLSAHNEVSTVGFFGHSQGGWIAPLAASRWPDTSFVISSAGPAVSPSREAHWGFVRNVRDFGGDQSDEKTVRDLVDAWHLGVRSSQWSSFDLMRIVAQSKPWFDSSGLSELSNRPDPQFAEGYRVYMDYDPLPILKSLEMPMLSILASDDESIDTTETEVVFDRLRDEGLNIRIKKYQGYDHSMRLISSQGKIRSPGHPEDYFQLQARFIKDSMR